MTAGTPLSAATFLRAAYWRLRSRPSDAVHIARMLSRSVVDGSRLRRLAGQAYGRPRMAIALTEHMGDIVAAEPLLRLARSRYPDAWICWFTKPAYASIPACFPQVDQVFPVSCLTEWALLKRLDLFDIVWDLHHDGRQCSLCRIPMPRPGISRSQDNYYDLGNLLDMFCECAGVPQLTDSPRLTPPPAAVQHIDALSLPQRFVVIHARSNETRRDWPADKWRDLLSHIQACHGLPVVEVGTEALVLPADGDAQRSLCGHLSILETAEVIRRSTLFVGIDSGPAHLANATGVPGVILLGAFANFVAPMPYSGGYANGERANIVRASGPVADLPVADVAAAIDSALGIFVSAAPDS